MKDLVEREIILDALDEIESEVADGGGFQYEKWRRYFCELPSAQPEPQRDSYMERLYRNQINNGAHNNE